MASPLTGNRGCVTRPGVNPRALRGTRLLALPFPFPPKGGNKMAGTSLWSLGLSLGAMGAAAAQSWLGSCRSVGRWAHWGPVAWWEAGQEGPGKPRQGRGSAGRPLWPAPVGGTHKGGFVYRWPWSQREGVLPLSWAAGRQSTVASKDLAVSLCGRPHPPRKERCMGYFLLLSPPSPISPGT